MKNTATEKAIDSRENEVAHKKSNTNWIAVGAWLVSFVTATFVLLGYGVSLAVESLFGIPHAALFDSTFELLDLASIAVLEILPTLSEWLTNWENYEKLYKPYGIFIAIIVAIWTIAAVAGWCWQPKRKKNAAKPVATTQSERRYWGRTAKGYWMTYLGLVFGVVLYPLVSLLGVVVLLFGLAILAMVPIIGMGAATAHVNKWVIAPEHCMPIRSFEVRRQLLARPPKAREPSVNVAYCVAVKKEGNVIAQGRVVLYTSKAVVLVDESGRAQRVPTGDAIVEAVGDI